MARRRIPEKLVRRVYFLACIVLTALREKLIKIGAKVVRHGRYITFQLMEVAISRALFANILRLIDGPRPRPAAT